MCLCDLISEEKTIKTLEHFKNTCAAKTECTGRALLGVSRTQKTLTCTRGLTKFLLIITKTYKQKATSYTGKHL